MSYYYVSSGVTSTGVSVSNGDYLIVSEGGVAITPTIGRRGVLEVYSGGTATGIDWTPCEGTLYIYPGAQATFAGSYSGVYYGSDGYLLGSAEVWDSSEVASDWRVCVMNSGIASNTYIHYADLEVYSGGVASSISMSWYGCCSVYSGGSANDVIVGDRGTMVVASGGTATDIEADGNLYVREGASADKIKVNGTLYVNSGGTATEIDWTPCVGGLSIEDGAHVTFTSEYSGVYYGEYGQLKSNAATMENMNLASGSGMFVMADGVANRITIGAYGAEMIIWSGGVANDATGNGGNIRVSSGGIANNAEINANCYFSVSSGGTANNTTVNQYGHLVVSSGGTADKTIVKGWGRLEVYSGGTATNVDWTPCEGYVIVSEGALVTFANEYSGVYYGKDHQLLSSAMTLSGIAMDDSYPEMYVMNGGMADNITVSGWGMLYISSGGTANEAIVSSGYMYVYSGGVAKNAAVSSGGSIILDSGGVASDTTVSYGGRLYVSSGGKLTGRMFFDYGLFVSAYEGAIVDFNISERRPSDFRLVDDLSAIQGNPLYTLTVSGTETTGSYRLAGYAADFNETITVVNTSGVELGTLAVADGTKEIGGVKYALTLNKENVLSVMVGEIDPNVFTGELTNATKEITAGSSALCVDVNISGLLKVLDGGTADYTTVNSGGTLHVSEGGVANYTTLNRNFNDDGFMVFKGGVASNTTVDDYGMMIVSSGGSAIDTTLLLSGRCIVYGVASNTVNSGGKLRISSGGVASKTTVVSSNGLYVYDDGTANETTVSSGAGLYVHGGVASNTTVHSSGELFIHSGGTAVGATANASGGIGVEGVASNIIVNSDGVAEVLGTVCNVTISSGGRLYFGAGGKLTGKMTFENGAVVSSFENSFVDFDLTRTSIGAEALLNNLSAIAGEIPLYTLTVGGSEAYGEYKLAEGAADFNETITVVNTSGTKLGTLTVGSKAMAGGAAYTLNLTDGSLSVTVEEPENGPLEPLNNYLYDKKLDPVINTNVTEEYGTVLTEAGQEIRLDKIGTVDYSEEHYHNHVGKSAEQSDADYTFDYAKIVLEHGAKLSFHAEATAAATFTVYNLIYNEKKDTYSLKKLQTLKLADKDKDGVFTADSKKPIQLQVSGPYYVSMQFKDKKAAEAYYNVRLNGADKGTEFFLDDDDGWNNWLYDKKKTPADNSENLKSEDIDSVGDSIQLDKKCYVDGDNFVGFGDDTDFVKFSLHTAANLSLNLYGVGAAANVKNSGALKVVIYSFDAAKKKMTALQTTSVKAADLIAGTANTKLKLLEAGDYYISVKSTNAKKGDKVYYTMSVGSGTVFFANGDGWNDYVYDKKKTPAVNTDVTAVAGFTVNTGNIGETVNLDYDTYTFKGKNYTGFVGHNDATDFVKLNVAKAGTASFKVDATDAAKIEIWSFDGDKLKMKSLQSTALKKTEVVGGVQMYGIETKAYAFKEPGEYYLAITSTNASKGGNAYYNVSLLDTDIIDGASLESALAMPDALSFASSGSDLLADASAFDKLASLDDASAWQSIAKLA